MLSKEEILRRAKRLMELPPDERPVKHYTIMKVAGTGDARPLGTILKNQSMGPEMQRRLSRAFELVENDQIPDLGPTVPFQNKYKRLKLKREKNPPCEPVMILDVSRGTPRLVTEFHNPRALPETLFNKVKR